MVKDVLGLTGFKQQIWYITKWFVVLKEHWGREIGGNKKELKRGNMT